MPYLTISANSIPPKFIMSTTKGKYQRFLLPALLLVLGISIYFGYPRKQQDHEGQVLIQTRAIQTKTGWGYDILANGKVYIHQDFIPAIPGKHSFLTAEDALKVGNLVVAKMTANQLPSVTVNDLKSLGIGFDSIVSK